MSRKWKRLALVPAALLGILVLTLGGYVAYLQAQYYRIADNTPLEVDNPRQAQLTAGTPYTAVTCNLGFGAYGPENSFFMDTGQMADGTPTRGQWGRARSREEVLAHTDAALDTLLALDADLLLLQEVDENAHRSFRVNQRQITAQAFPDHSRVWGENFHSAFLFYPFTDPHGDTVAGLQTLSRYRVDRAVRRSYPVDESFFVKFTDLDRCFTLLYLPVEGTDRQLVLVHSHMSAYDEGGTVRAWQLELLCDVIAREYEQGNYVIVGGDFNHALYGTAHAFESGQAFPGWVQTLDDADLPDHFAFVAADNGFAVPTCRGADLPYTPGVNYTTVVDGFLVSDNVQARAENIDTRFAFSDHNPVKLTFTLAA